MYTVEVLNCIATYIQDTQYIFSEDGYRYTPGDDANKKNRREYRLPLPCRVDNRKYKPDPMGHISDISIDNKSQLIYCVLFL